jgi:hypothetical protein
VRRGQFCRQPDEREWVDRFMHRLREVANDIKPAEAVAHAHEMYDELGDADPVRSAEIYAEELRRSGSR